MDLLVNIVVPVLIVIVAMLFVGFAFTRVYHRSTRETALVRTGNGGRKIATDGGLVVIPGLHELTPIHMGTTRLEVKRENQSSLITLDRMRVDVGVEFYVTVESSEDGIAKAAQTLGKRTGDVSFLREMIEGKLVDGLRGVAASMNLDDLHEKRTDFVMKVQEAVAEDLKKNGLALESVSLTALDQTAMDGLDEDNVFNATGMKNQAERIAVAKRRRAEVESETAVAISRSRQDAEIQQYEIQREQEAARVEQAVEMETLRAREATDKAEKSEEAERASQTARITRESAVEQAEVQRKLKLETAEQDRKIIIEGKSRDESRAKAEADTARAEAVTAAESVKTASAVAEAERSKRIVLIAAEQSAQEAAVSIRVSAAAEKEAAADRAAAMLELANASASEITIRAAAEKTAKLAEAEGNTRLYEAENSLSAQIIDFRLAQERLKAMPQIIAELVKPAEKIGSINIHKVDGFGSMTGGTAGGDAVTSGGKSGGMINDAFNEMRAMHLQTPLLKQMGQSLGLNFDASTSDMVSEVLHPQQPAAADVATDMPAPTNVDAPADKSA